jgi:rod shape-determining protein MreD
VNVTYTSREQIEVYRFPWPVAIGVPLAAIILQAFLPIRMHFFAVFDLPLLVTIFFSVARRNPITGLLTGSAIGLVQDALSGKPLGVFGIAKTVIGYVASSLGVKIDVENPGTRFLMTGGFYLLHELVYFAILRGLVGETHSWRWTHELGAAVANGLMAIVLFAALDKFKQRT